MKIKIGSYEAKTKLPELLRQVKTGKSFTITNRGEAIADLVPSAGTKAKDTATAVKRLKAFMLAEPVHGVNIKRLIEDGRARVGPKRRANAGGCIFYPARRINPVTAIFPLAPYGRRAC